MLGPLHSSSSWQWQPYRAVCRLYQTLLWTALVDFAKKKIAKCTFYISEQATKFVWCGFEGLFPPKTAGKVVVG